MKPQYNFCCYVTILSHTHSFTEKREWSMSWGAKMQVWVGLCPIDCTLAYYYKHIRWLKHMWMAYGFPFECNFVYLFGKSVFVYITFKYRFDFFFYSHKQRWMMVVSDSKSSSLVFYWWKLWDGKMDPTWFDTTLCDNRWSECDVSWSTFDGHENESHVYCTKHFGNSSFICLFCMFVSLLFK